MGGSGGGGQDRRRCCLVVGCPNRKSSMKIAMHRLPEAEAAGCSDPTAIAVRKRRAGLRAQWLHLAGVSEDNVTPDLSFVCARHFPPNAYQHIDTDNRKVRKLKADAVPGIFLPGQKVDSKYKMSVSVPGMSPGAASPADGATTLEELNQDPKLDNDEEGSLAAEESCLVIDDSEAGGDSDGLDTRNFGSTGAANTNQEFHKELEDKENVNSLPPVDASRPSGDSAESYTCKVKENSRIGLMSADGVTAVDMDSQPSEEAVRLPVLPEATNGPMSNGHVAPEKRAKTTLETAERSGDDDLNGDSLPNGAVRTESDTEQPVEFVLAIDGPDVIDEEDHQSKTARRSRTKNGKAERTKETGIVVTRTDASGDDVDAPSSDEAGVRKQKDRVKALDEGEQGPSKQPASRSESNTHSRKDGPTHAGGQDAIPPGEEEPRARQTKDDEVSTVKRIAVSSQARSMSSVETTETKRGPSLKHGSEGEHCLVGAEARAVEARSSIRNTIKRTSETVLDKPGPAKKLAIEEIKSQARMKYSPRKVDLVKGDLAASPPVLRKKRDVQCFLSSYGDLVAQEIAQKIAVLGETQASLMNKMFERVTTHTVLMERLHKHLSCRLNSCKFNSTFRNVGVQVVSVQPCAQRVTANTATPPTATAATAATTTTVATTATTNGGSTADRRQSSQMAPPSTLQQSVGTPGQLHRGSLGVRLQQQQQPMQTASLAAALPASGGIVCQVTQSPPSASPWAGGRPHLVTQSGPAMPTTATSATTAAASSATTATTTTTTTNTTTTSRQSAHTNNATLQSNASAQPSGKSSGRTIGLDATVIDLTDDEPRLEPEPPAVHPRTSTTAFRAVLSSDIGAAVAPRKSSLIGAIPVGGIVPSSALRIAVSNQLNQQQQQSQQRSPAVAAAAAPPPPPPPPPTTGAAGVAALAARSPGAGGAASRLRVPAPAPRAPVSLVGPRGAMVSVAQVAQRMRPPAGPTQTSSQTAQTSAAPRTLVKSPASTTAGSAPAPSNINSTASTTVHLPPGIIMRPAHQDTCSSQSQSQQSQPQQAQQQANGSITPTPSRRKTKHPAALPPTPTYTDQGILRTPPAPIIQQIKRTPKGIVLTFDAKYEPGVRYAATEKYQVYSYVETNDPPSTATWNKVGEIGFLRLPVACTFTQFEDGHRIFFAVRGVDRTGRLGSFNEPKAIDLREDVIVL